jgi:hypothetical protein
MGTALAPVAATPGMEDTLAAQATMTVPLQTAAPRPEIGLSFE